MITNLARLRFGSISQNNYTQNNDSETDRINLEANLASHPEMNAESSEPNYYTEESNYYNNFEDSADQPNYNPSPQNPSKTNHNLKSDASHYAYLHAP